MRDLHGNSVPRWILREVAPEMDPETPHTQHKSQSSWPQQVCQGSERHERVLCPHGQQQPRYRHLSQKALGEVGPWLTPKSFRAQPLTKPLMGGTPLRKQWYEV